jgi:hypothetical protein
MDSAATVLINAYYGDSFAPHPVSHHERQLTEKLIQDCDRIIRLPESNVQRNA